MLRPLGPTRQGLMKRCRGAFFLGLWSLLFSLTGWAADSIQPAREMELIHLVRNECGACHGGQLKGGLGPALQPQCHPDSGDHGLLDSNCLGDQ